MKTIGIIGMGKMSSSAVKKIMKENLTSDDVHNALSPLYEPIKEVSIKQLTIEELRVQFESRNRRTIEATPIVADNIWEGWFQCARANNIIKE